MYHSLGYRFVAKKFMFPILTNILTIIVFMLCLQCMGQSFNGGCKEALGLESGEIPDSQFSAMNQYGDMDPSRGRLNFEQGHKGWCSADQASIIHGLWWQVDLGTIKEVAGIAVQAANWFTLDRVTSFLVQYDLYGSGNLITLKNKAGGDRIFDTSTLSTPNQVATVSWTMRPMRTIRLVIKGFAGQNVCLRAEILSCQDRGISRSIYMRYVKGMISDVTPLNGNDDTTSTNLECVQLCIDLQNCIAVNYFTDTGLCQLLPNTTRTDDLLPRPNSIYVYSI